MTLSGLPDITSKTRVYIDTNIVIYALEGHFDKARAAKNLLRHIKAQGAALFTSALSRAESLYGIYKSGKLERLRDYEQFFTAPTLEILDFDGDLAARAAQYAAGLGLTLLDAVHYISALEAGCDLFLTSDTRFTSCPEMDVFLL